MSEKIQMAEGVEVWLEDGACNASLHYDNNSVVVVRRLHSRHGVVAETCVCLGCGVMFMRWPEGKPDFGHFRPALEMNHDPAKEALHRRWGVSKEFEQRRKGKVCNLCGAEATTKVGGLRFCANCATKIEGKL